MPYDHKNTTPDGVPSQKMKSLLEELNHLHCQKRCMIGSGGGSVGLVVHLFIVLIVVIITVSMLLFYSISFSLQWPMGAWVEVQ